LIDRNIKILVKRL